MKLKKSFIIIWLTIIFIGIVYLFWRNEFVYGLLTPIPKKHNIANCRDKIIIPQNMRRLYSSLPIILISSIDQDYTQNDSGQFALWKKRK